MHLQRTAGNRAVSTLLQRKVEKIGSEDVDVAGDAEMKEATEIIARIKATYGIDLSSAATKQGLEGEYGQVPKQIKDKLTTKAWRMADLRALETALAHYAPILGAARGSSTRKAADQEVTSVGKLAFSIDEDTKAGDLDPETLGEYFSTKKNMGLFGPSEGHKADFAKESDQLVGTFVHECGHGLLKYALADFVKVTTYWKDEDTKLAKSKRLEDPPTSYGRTNAEEDLCETAMFYFVDPKTLETRCPKRYAFMQKVGKGWLPPPAKSPVIKPSPTAPPPVAAVGKATAPTTAPPATATPKRISGLVSMWEKIARAAGRP